MDIKLVAIITASALWICQVVFNTHVPRVCVTTFADIYLMLDTSGSMNIGGFNKQKNFVLDFIDSLIIGPNDVQVGIGTFGSTVQNEFFLNNFTTKADVMNATSTINYRGGYTHTADALNFVRTQIFIPSNGDRPQAPNILIMMTDGESSSGQDPTQEARLIHGLNDITVIAIGVGAFVDLRELAVMATGPHRLIVVADFDALQVTLSDLLITTCDVDGGWTPWSDWSPCSQTCGNGTQIRQRTCTNPVPQGNGAPCRGPDTEPKTCFLGLCIVTLPECLNQKQDVIFMLDTSTSISQSDFGTVVTFVSNIVRGLDIQSQSARVSVLTFGNRVQAQFHLNSFIIPSDILSAISKTPYLGGMAYTGDALRYIRETSLLSTNGARNAVPKVVVLVTNGRSADLATTQAEAKRLTYLGVTVIVIGIGPQVIQKELEDIASDPDTAHIFYSTLAALDNITSTVTQRICAVQATPTPPHPQEIYCDAKADVVFLIDSSSSSNEMKFNRTKEFIKHTVRHLRIGPDDLQVGVDTFSDVWQQWIALNQYSTFSDLARAIDRIAYTAGPGTASTDVLRQLREVSLSARSGARSPYVQIGVIITDRRAPNQGGTALQAQMARAMGMQLLAIGIGNGYDIDELNAITGDPSGGHVFTADNYNMLEPLHSLLATRICDESATEEGLMADSNPNCTNPVDLIYLIDSSDSVGQQNFERIKSFLIALTQDFIIGSNGVQAGVVQFSSRPSQDFYMNAHPGKILLLQAIHDLRYHSIAGGIDLEGALHLLHSDIFSLVNGNRPAVPDAVILITDSASEHPNITTAEARKLHSFGIRVFVIAVGNNLNPTEISEISSNPARKHTIFISSFTELLSKKNEFISLICNQSLVDATPTPPDFLIATGKPICHDTISDCDQNDYDHCANFGVWARQNCPKYCGYCSMDAVGGYNGQCFYQNTSYGQGESWEDGCDYECACTDADRGQYTCYNTCPVYHNLPPHCVLTAITGECCLKPVCNFNPTYTTDVGQNLRYKYGLSVCEHAGIHYYQGQSWTVGCQYECTCVDSSIGKWECRNRCPSYTDLTSGCTMMPITGRCCPEPRCEFDMHYGRFNGSGTTSGVGSLSSGSSQQSCMDIIPHCSELGADMCTNYPGYAAQNCKRFCNLCTDPTIGPNDRCVYEGVAHSEGGKWNVGCDQECVCEDARSGFYRCYGLCPEFTHLPDDCFLVSGACCPEVVCSGGVFIGSQQDNSSIYVVHNHPGTTPMTATGPRVITGCLHNGDLFVEGLRWHDGCQHLCVCVDGDKGIHSCMSRCPTYGSLPPGCSLVSSLDDPCCQYPVCTRDPVTNQFPVLMPPPFNNSFTESGYAIHNPTIIGACDYNGTTYPDRSTWQDGCSKTCTCMAGNFRCDDRCPTWVGIPSRCSLVASPTDPCCNDISCLLPAPGPTGSTTSGNVCLHNGVAYAQNQTWTEGCERECTCADAASDYVTCVDRCPTYHHLPIGCTMSRTSTCCEEPVCTRDILPFDEPIGLLAEYTGTGLQTSLIARCMYKGVAYNQGDRWQDGCSLDCECTDSTASTYRCKSRCRHYAYLPTRCSLVSSPTDACCLHPVCTDPVATCVDKLDCSTLQGTACQPIFTTWASKYCPSFCNLCNVPATPSLP